MSPVDFKKCQCRVSLSLIILCPCYMSNLRNIPVTCHSIFVKPCRMSIGLFKNLGNGHVALSNLRVKGHFHATMVMFIEASNTERMIPVN